MTWKRWITQGFVSLWACIKDTLHTAVSGKRSRHADFSASGLEHTNKRCCAIWKILCGGKQPRGGNKSCYLNDFNRTALVCGCAAGIEKREFIVRDLACSRLPLRSHWFLLPSGLKACLYYRQRGMYCEVEKIERRVFPAQGLFKVNVPLQGYLYFSVSRLGLLVCQFSWLEGFIQH